MKIKILFIALALFTSCSKSKPEASVIPESGFFIRGADLSALPQIESTHAVFYNLSGQEENFLTILKNSGVNTVRLRLWNHPVTGYSSFDEVKTFSAKIDSLGLKVWIDLHYSDTWADPSHQEPPLAWQGISFDALNDSVYNFTKKVVSEIVPDFIQIGNEINPGFLLPEGAISNKTQFLRLLSSGVKAVRDYSDSAKIIIHYAGIEEADWFFSTISQVDYDIIGISYYPVVLLRNIEVFLSLPVNPVEGVLPVFEGSLYRQEPVPVEFFVNISNGRQVPCPLEPSYGDIFLLGDRP